MWILIKHRLWKTTCLVSSKTNLRLRNAEAYQDVILSAAWKSRRLLGKALIGMVKHGLLVCFEIYSYTLLCRNLMAKQDLAQLGFKEKISSDNSLSMEKQQWLYYSAKDVDSIYITSDAKIFKSKLFRWCHAFSSVIVGKPKFEFEVVNSTQQMITNKMAPDHFHIF